MYEPLPTTPPIVDQDGLIRMVGASIRTSSDVNTDKG